MIVRSMVGSFSTAVTAARSVQSKGAMVQCPGVVEPSSKRLTVTETAPAACGRASAASSGMRKKEMRLTGVDQHARAQPGRQSHSTADKNRGFDRSSQRCCQYSCWRPVAQGLAGRVLRRWAMRLRAAWECAATIGPLGQVLAEQAVRVLVGAPLPRTLRITEVDLHVGGHGERGVLRQLEAAVPGERAAQGRRERPHLARHRRDDAGGVLAPAGRGRVEVQPAVCLELDRRARPNRSYDRETWWSMIWTPEI